VSVIRCDTVDTVTVSMISRTRGMDETCECEKVISSVIYKAKDNLVSIDQVITASQENPTVIV